MIRPTGRRPLALAKGRLASKAGFGRGFVDQIGDRLGMRGQRGVAGGRLDDALGARLSNYRPVKSLRGLSP